MSKILSLTVGLALALSSPAGAQTGASAAIDPARFAAAERLLQAMDYDRLLDRTNEALIAEAQRSLPARLEASAKEPLPEDLKAKLLTLLSDWMRQTIAANRADIRKGTVLIYARHFTAAELDHMVELQRDPVMVKMQAQLPELMAESMALGQAGLQREMPKLMERLRGVIADYVQGKGAKPAS